MAEFDYLNKDEILDISKRPFTKQYIQTVLKPLLEKNLMEQARKKMLEDEERGAQVFLLTALGEDQYFLNSKKILDAEFSHLDLVSFTIPNKITTIGKRAFAGNLLKSIEIPYAVTEIGDGAFEDMNIDTIKIPKRFKSIMGDIFNAWCLRNATIKYRQ